jgi:ribosome-binding ATPase YchF (GTP1/OBG family)
VRCFEDEDIIHVSQSVDPVRDIAIINIELALSDLEQVENKLSKGKKKLSANEQAVLHTIQDALSEGLPARSLEQDLTKEEALFVQSLHLLTMKPQIYAANVDDESLKEGNVFSQTLMDHIHDHSGQQDSMVLCSAKFESELVGIDNDEERAEYLEMCGLSAAETGLNRLAKSSYDLLRLSKWGGVVGWCGRRCVGDVWI